MKKLTAIFFMILLIIACDEDFEIKSEFTENYVLTCIIDAGSPYQVATITRSYDVEGYDPFSNTEDKYIQGAEVSLSVGWADYQFKDSSATRSDTSRYRIPVKFYYTNEMMDADGWDISIEALLPDGKRLSSSTRVPQKVIFDSENSTSIIQTGNDPIVYVNWERREEEQFIFDPRLKIIYYKFENGIKQRFEKKVPIRILQNRNEEVLVYSSPSYRSFITYTNEVIDRAMHEIAGDDPDKGNYYIGNAVLELFTFDRFLSSYFIELLSLDRFSIRLDQIDYNNVEGGLGVFGAFVKQSYEMNFNTAFIRSFGYNRNSDD
ncbi:MAG: DUF4249 family protein [Melioribacteraceae bacterium]|nr:DUF4249 family protein [Melioribacteraceae bacterium]